MIRVTVTLDGAAAARLAWIAAQIARPEALYRAAGRAVANRLRRHFRELDGQRANRLGGKRQHFWLQVRTATQDPEVEPGGATVTIAHLAFAQKLYGGTIVAKRARALTIPLHPDAYGRRASVFEQEQGVQLFRPKGKRVLMADLDGTGAVPIYVLAKAITQAPDPEALPDRSELEAEVLRAGERVLGRLGAEG